MIDPEGVLRVAVAEDEKEGLIAEPEFKPLLEFHVRVDENVGLLKIDLELSLVGGQAVAFKQLVLVDAVLQVSVADDPWPAVSAVQIVTDIEIGAQAVIDMTVGDGKGVEWQQGSFSDLLDHFRGLKVEVAIHMHQSIAADESDRIRNAVKVEYPRSHFFGRPDINIGCFLTAFSGVMTEGKRKVGQMFLQQIKRAHALTPFTQTRLPEASSAS
jgi:hypothetical protein